MQKVPLPRSKNRLALSVHCAASVAAFALWVLGLMQANHLVQSIGLCLVAISVLLFIYTRGLLSDYKLEQEMVGHRRGRPRMRWATMLRWICSEPPYTLAARDHR